MSTWIKREDCEHPDGVLLVGFFWVCLSDGTVDLAYGDPIGNSVFADGAGDYEGLHSELTPPFDYFMWLETPLPPGKHSHEYSSGELPTYTVKKVEGPGSSFSKIHWSHDSEETCCGQEINEYWEILTSTSDRPCTCRKCLQAENFE